MQIGMFLYGLRAISWTFQGPEKERAYSVWREFCTLRKYAQPTPSPSVTNGKGTQVPTKREKVTIFSSARLLASAVLWMLAFDVVHIHIHMLSPSLFRVAGGHPEGLLAGSWPSPRTMYLSGCTYTLTYLTVQYVYAVATFTGVVLLGQERSEWPPLFGPFWKSTSLRCQQMQRFA